MNPGEPLGGAAPEEGGWLREAAIAVPVTPSVLPDGEPTLQIGEVARYAAFNHRQGDNPEHDRGDCGIICCADVLSQFGVRRTEAEVVWHATECGELHVAAGDPDGSGGTLPAEVARILCDYGVPAHAWHGTSTGQVAVAVQRGHGVIVAVNAGILWANPRVLGHGQANHAVTVTGIARHPYDGALQGFYINDSGSGRSAQFIAEHLMTTAFARTGGFCVITDQAHGMPRPA